ncbi:MAG: DNA gyrase subunit A [Clostridiales bacterium]|jgi:DNA gyrase subunit A|nr:DNA gyrase subunit A [Clostridiales bacterium]
MAKKKNEEYEKIVDRTKYVRVPVEDEMKKSFIAYAMAVNVSRAIPDVRDGLKPVHRRIMYAMSELNLYAEKPYRKCARIVGDVLGKYHPHGDSSVYSALVRLAQDFSIRAPLVDGHGNFGSVDGDPPAAQRYTEARMSKIAGEMLRDIEKETVDYYPNFDDTLMQPTVLPARFPNLLVNGSDGIAVGMATNIPPHNLAEVIDGTVALIDNPDATVDELIAHIPAPDYPTGGVLMGRMGLRHAYRTGRGSFVLRAKAEIEEYGAKEPGGENNRSRIVITELPYQINKAQLIETIADMVKDKRLEGISDIREETDRKGMRVVIEIKRDAQANVVLNTLYKHTNLQISGGIIFLALVNGEPKILNLKEILYHYLEHQRDVVIRRTRYDLAKAEEREHIVEGLVIALANIDAVIAIIKKSRDKFEAGEALMARFTLTEKQATAILEMRLQRLTSLEVEQLKSELNELKARIAELKGILASPQKINGIIKQELIEIRDKYGDERKTELATDYEEIDIGDLIDEEDVVISMTHFGYIKRLPVVEYKTQRRGGKGVLTHKPKEEDFVENMFVTSTHDDVMFFTNLGRVYRIKGYEVPEEQKQARGRAVVNLLQLADGEKVQAVIPVKAGTQGNMLMATRNGLVKKTGLTEFESIRKVGKIAIKLLEGDELISVQLTNGRDELLLATAEGKCIRFSEDDVRSMGRHTQGVRAMKLNAADYAVDMIAVRSGFKILTLSQYGYGKRTEIEDYRLQSRAGKGVKAGILNAKTGKLVNLKLVADDDDLMVISDDGTIIRMRAKEISVIGRDTQGVRVMRVKPGSEIVCVAVAKGEVMGEDGGEGE